MSAGALLTALLAAIVALALLAKKLRVPYPIVFVIAGAVLALVPGVPTITLEPDLVFLLFLPPLIFGDGWTTDVRDFLTYRKPILFLAIGLVVFTSVCVAEVAHWLIGFPLALGFVLGAILSPTDAVATDAIAENLRLPRRLSAILSGESLVNDASGLVIYAFAVSAVLTGTFSLGLALAQFVYVVAAGLAIGIGGGLLVARLITAIRASGLSDDLIVISISLVTPFALYVPADALHASGVLAAMSGGMVISRKASSILTASSRIAAGSVWNLLFFTFNGAAFVLVGLQLRAVSAALQAYPAGSLVLWSLAIAAVVVLTRYAWVFAVPVLRKTIDREAAAREGGAEPWQTLFIAGTAGMRGVVSLAAALALPVTFPRRELILFVVFVAIIVTLVGEGLLMPFLIARWNVRESDGAGGRSRALARVRMGEAVQQRFREIEPSFTNPLQWEIAGRLTSDYELRVARAASVLDAADGSGQSAGEPVEFDLRREAIRAERRALFELRGAGLIGDDVYRELEREIDYAESRLFG